MADPDHGAGAIPRRPLGRTGVQVSALGLGGHHLGDLKTVDEAIRLVHEAVDAGITFFDNCWEYWNGRAEDWLGRALQGRRDPVFLMTKTSIWIWPKSSLTSLARPFHAPPNGAALRNTARGGEPACGGGAGRTNKGRQR